MTIKGTVFDIKKYAIHDGPGIRTTVFFKGCSLDCWWCHNPESRSPEPERVPARIGTVGHWAGQEETVGRRQSVDEVMVEILKDQIFYEQSGGGVTFSGGEPTHQIDFLEAALAACRKAGIHTAVDTSGHAEQRLFDRIAPLTDLFLFDLKLIDNSLHQKYTGVSNEPIFENLRRLVQNDARIWIRLPLIPGITDTDDNLKGVANLLKSMKSVRTVSLLPYNLFGEDKFRRFNLEARAGSMSTQTADRIASLTDRFENLGYQVNTGG